MRQYKDFRPTSFDTHIPQSNREEWYVVSCLRNRDSSCMEESNFATALQLLQKATLSREAEDNGESDHETLRFGHWGPGWFEIILVRPNTLSYKVGEEIEHMLSQYPILDEIDLSEREVDAANQVWSNCYSIKERIDYMTKHRNQFDFTSIKEMIACVRGKFFAGYPAELLSE